MPNYSLAATGPGGRTVAELTVEKPTRLKAITEGVLELLRQSQFPPEASQFWERGANLAQREQDLLDVFDICLEKFSLQFSCRELQDTPVPSVESRLPASPAAPQPTAFPFPLAASESEEKRATPRQLLRQEYARLNKTIADVRSKKTALDRHFAMLQERRTECQRLLKQPRLKTVKHGTSKSKAPAATA